MNRNIKLILSIVVVFTSIYSLNADMPVNNIRRELANYIEQERINQRNNVIERRQQPAQEVHQQNLNQAQQAANCSICHEALIADVEDLRTLPCGHTLHVICLEEWERVLQERDLALYCPECRLSNN